MTTNATRRRTGVSTTLILFAQLMLIIDATIIQVALPQIRHDLGFTPAGLVWVVTAYTLPYGGLLLLGGRLGDIRGRKRLFMVGLGLFTVASLAGGLAPTSGALIAARIAQGVGAALTAPGVLALLTVNAPDEAARHRAFALFAAVTSGGLTLGLVLGGIITDVAAWRWTLLVNVPVGIVVLLLVPRFVVESDRRRGRLDVVGAITATVGSVGLVWTLVEAPEAGWASLRTIVGFVLSCIVFGVFVIAQKRSVNPMLDLRLVRNPVRMSVLLVNLLVIGAQMSMFFLTVQFLQSLRMSPLQVGLGFLPMSAAIFVFSKLAPRLVARYTPGRLIIVGTAVQSVALVLLAIRVGSGSDYFGTAFLPLLMDGAALGMVLMPVTALALRGVTPDRAGSMSGMLQTTQQLGAAIGLAIVVTVYASHAETHQFVPGAAPAYLTAASFSALALLAAIIAVLVRPKDDASTHEPQQR